MSAIASNAAYLTMDTISHSPTKPSSPASPSSQFISQQSATSRSFINLSSEGIRGQATPFPLTPTASQLSLDSSGTPYLNFLRTWTDSHVARWLADIKCGNQADVFKANDIRGDILLELDQETLKEMGVASVGDRLRILNAVKLLRHRVASKTIVTIPSRTSIEHSTDSTSRRSPQEKVETSNTSRSSYRRLEAGRPAPLQLPPDVNRGDLPGLIREQQPPDSARSNVHPGARPLPQPHQSSIQSVSTPGSSHSVNSGIQRPSLPPLPPPPRSQPPLPPTNANRTPLRSMGSGWATPTQSEVPAFAQQGLPPPPTNQGHLTPSSSNWSGYYLPPDPRSGNIGSAKSPIGRSTSPLIPGRIRPNPAVTSNHGRNGSLGVSSPVATSKLPPRPSTGGHPYANAQAAALQPPINHQTHNLSPIEETFQPSTSSSTPSPPSAYTVGRGPFNPSTPSHPQPYTLDDLRRKLVKFILPDDNRSFTIDVATCSGGVDVLEKALRKFGKGSSRSADPDGSKDYIQTDEGGLSIDGWGVYLDMGQVDGPGEALTEAELMSICHAPPDHPTREHGLVLRRNIKLRRYDSPHSQNNSNATITSRNTKRASSISILSGLGVRDPERALDPPSPSSGRSSPAVSNSKRPSKLRNFFGQRPPSELITNHLTEYFPNTEKRVLERTARNSILRSNTTSTTRRDSVSSFYHPPLPSRFSTSTQGSRTISPSRASISSTVPPPPVPDKQLHNEFYSEDIPRMSLSTEDGQSIDLHPDDSEHISVSTHPELLPPIPFPSESFSESLEGITGKRVSRSNTSRRMSYMTELRSRRDRSDTASLMTVDEITAEVESRRVSKAVEHESPDLDDWTKVNTEGSTDGSVDSQETPVDVEVEEVEEESEEEATTLLPEDAAEDDDDAFGLGKAVTYRRANKWIKGALIGAGSFGKVYLGMDASNGLLMAVKQVELPTGNAANQERKKSMLSALEREIELLKNLQHENIVQYLYSSMDEDYLNIFLEYVPGGSVTALLRSYGAFEEPLVKNFVRQILQGLNYLHERDIIHRDIKGANILVDNKGGIKISDFGISKKVDDNLLTGNRMHRPSLQGSVFWMAPEVVKQSGHTLKADIWSVGCLVVEMLTGEHPWAQLTQMQAIFKIGSTSAKPTIPSDISAEAQDFLQHTFELDHELRPTASELLLHPWVAKQLSKQVS